MLHLKIITPRKVVIDEEVSSVTVPSLTGELTILPRHTKLLTGLTEGIITIKKNSGEDLFAVGQGYLETDGKTLQILVSRAYGQAEINEELTKEALDEAKKLMASSLDEKKRAEVTAAIRRSLIDLKLLKKRRRAV